MLAQPIVSRAAAAFLVVLVSTGWPGASRAQCQSTEFDEVISPDVFSMDQFGSAIAVSGAVAMVGAPLDGEGGRDYGAVYVMGDLRTWGWILLIWGIVILIGAASVYRGGQLYLYFIRSLLLSG